MIRILLPTDFSDNSWNAISYALQLFKDERCTFTLLNTYTPIIYQLESAELGTAQFGLEDAMRQASQEGLERIQTRIETEFNNPNHTIASISSFNTLTEEIRELYEGNMMDLIIMGTQGASGLKEILFGSNAIHVINKAKCPVMAIPSDYSFEAPHEILFPTDYLLNYDERHIGFIKKIAKRFGARINVMHVATSVELTSEQKENQNKLEALIQGTCHLFHDIRNNYVPEAIAEFQVRHKINLLTMINNKHSFFENLFFKSNIKHIGFHLNVPFLVIPSGI